jgi:pyruvate carboxylase subunit B
VKYIVTLGEARFEVEVSGDRVTVGDKTVTARLEPLGDTPLRVLHVDRTVWSLAMRHDAAGWAVQHGGRTRVLEVVDERTHNIRALTAGPAGAQAGGVVRAPMPGMVLRLEVEEGQRVSRGDGLLVLEAMKMENELRAPGDATVTRVYAVPGMAVEKGAPLVELGPAS